MSNGGKRYAYLISAVVHRLKSQRSESSCQSACHPDTYSCQVPCARSFISTPQNRAPMSLTLLFGITNREYFPGPTVSLGALTSIDVSSNDLVCAALIKYLHNKITSAMPIKERKF